MPVKVLARFTNPAFRTRIQTPSTLPTLLASLVIGLFATVLLVWFAAFATFLLIVMYRFTTVNARRIYHFC